MMIHDIPINMQSGPVSLVFDKFVDAEPGGELVPFYHFKILIDGETMVGHINFKVGDTRHIHLCAGHIGYEVLPSYRGNSYSYHACVALKPFISKVYKEVILTADPNNKPSIKIIEKLNASFLNKIDVPVDDPSYKSGSNKKKRYLWVL